MGAVAVAACGLLALSACSSSGSTDASSSAVPSTTTSTTSTTPSTSPSVNKSVLGASSSSSSATSSTSSAPASATSSKSAKGSKSVTPSTTKPAVKADPVGACLTANKESNTAITQWNTAVSSQSKTKLDAAAKKFRTTADNLRKLPAKSQDKGFATRVKAVAHDLDVMAKARFDGKTVTTSAYNKDSEKLRTYCQKLITNA